MSIPALRFSHIGIYVSDLARMRDFYVRVLGFVETDRGPLRGAELVFLSRDPAEHHQIVMATGRPDVGGFSTVNQISLRAQSLDDLREVYRQAEAEPDASDLRGITHVMAWSVYFKDPEGNRIEVFIDAPWYVSQPISEPIDLFRDDMEIYAETEARARQDPSFRAIEEWQSEVALRIAEADRAAQ